MKKAIFLPVLFAFVVLISLSFTDKKPLSSQNTGFAVVELFTSQGCSSCPSADRLLSEIVKENGDNEVFGLSFHVSYWNYLGWKDPYSNETFTKRQRDYGATFRSITIYTPQMVVNGKKEFVGSDRSNAKRAIAEALAEPSQHQLSLIVEKRDDKLVVNYDVEGPMKGYVINFALVERNIVTHVKRGENRNRTLQHDNVVRAFKTLPIQKTGQTELPIPNDLKTEDGNVIAYVQHKDGLAISGATRLVLK